MIGDLSVLAAPDDYDDAVVSEKTLALRDPLHLLHRACTLDFPLNVMIKYFSHF